MSLKFSAYLAHFQEQKSLNIFFHFNEFGVVATCGTRKYIQ